MKKTLFVLLLFLLSSLFLIGCALNSEADSDGDEQTFYAVFLYIYEGVPPTSLSVKEGEYLFVDEPVNEGYTFNGWYYDENCIVLCDDINSVPITSSMSFYASWKDYSTSDEEKNGEKNEATTLIIVPPTKLEYYINEELDFTGLCVSVEYENGEIIELEESVYSINLPDITEAGVYSCKISAFNIEAEFKFTILENLPIELFIKEFPLKTTYFENEEIDFDGLELYCIYENDREVLLDEAEYNIVVPEFEVGVNLITILYKDLEISFEVEIV